jgi:SAM-dependent methyltransferase
MIEDNYHETRLIYDHRRDILWKTLVESVFQKLVNPSDTVLDLGAGYGEFINNIRAKKRIAIDKWPDTLKYLDKDVKGIVGCITDLSSINNSSIDFVFSSNCFEHVTMKELSVCLGQLKEKMKPGATLNIVQPNFKYAYREYFDDYTHESIFTDISLSNFFESHGFETIQCLPKFLPLTIKSRIPVKPILIKLYLSLPFKIGGKQMMIRVKKK